MSSGPSVAAPDYKGLWTNYSNWLADVKSGLAEKQSLLNARAAAGGASPQSGTVQGDIASIKTAAESERSRIMTGATATALQDKVVGVSNPALPNVGMKFNLKSFKDASLNTLFEEVTIQPRVGGGEREVIESYTGKRLYQLGFSSEAQVRSAISTFKTAYGRDPSIMEAYYTAAYGIGTGVPKTAAQKTAAEFERVKQESAGIGTRRPKAELASIGARPDEETKSPWV